MGFLLGGVLSGTADAIKAGQDKKQQAVDTEREFKVHGLQTQAQAIQSKLGQLAPDDPNRQVLTQQLSRINSDTTDLFHPEKAQDSGAMAHLGRLISQHVLGHPAPSTAPPVTPGQQLPSANLGYGVNLPEGHTPAVQGPPPGPQTPEALKAIAAQKMADYQQAAAVPASGALPAAQQQEASRIKEGIDPKAVNDKPIRPNLKFYKNQESGQSGWYNANEPDKIPEGFDAVAPGNAGGLKPRAAWIKGKDGKIYSVALGADNQPIKGTEDYDAVPPIGYLPSIRKGLYTYTDDNGVVRQVPTQTSTSKDMSGVGGGPPQEGGNPPAQPPATQRPAGVKSLRDKAAAGKAAVGAKTGSNVSSSQPGGKAIGYKGSQQLKDLTKQVGKANVDLASATTNLGMMTRSAAEAKKGNGPAQVAITSAYLKGVVGGAGTGVRITKPEWDAAVQTKPWLQGVAAHFTPDGYLAGAVLSPQQIDQMTQEMRYKKSALEESIGGLKKQMEDQKATDQGQKPATSSSPVDDFLKNFPSK